MFKTSMLHRVPIKAFKINMYVTNLSFIPSQLQIDMEAQSIIENLARLSLILLAVLIMVASVPVQINASLYNTEVIQNVILFLFSLHW